MSDRLGQEREAIQSLMELLEVADKCRRLHERANMSLPEPLKRVLGIGVNGMVEPQRIEVPAPEVKSRPAEAESNWIWFRASEALPTSLVLAVLRAHGSDLTVREVISRTQEYLKKASAGTIANIGTRLDNAGIIERSPDGWRLLKLDRAPVMLEGFLWGPQAIFDKQEVATYRRDMILHVLGFFETGLQLLQLVERLKALDWLHAPANKDLVKADMDLLQQAKKVRRRGNTKKWQVVQEGK